MYTIYAVIERPPGGKIIRLENEIDFVRGTKLRLNTYLFTNLEDAKRLKNIQEDHKYYDIYKLNAEFSGLAEE